MGLGVARLRRLVIVKGRGLRRHRIFGACVVRIGIAPSLTGLEHVTSRNDDSVGGAPAFDLNGPDPGTYHLRWDKRGTVTCTCSRAAPRFYVSRFICG